jgi:hypothetical protein
MSDILLLALGRLSTRHSSPLRGLMMLLPNAKRLMLGYLFGARMTSSTLGLVIVAESTNSTTRPQRPWGWS